MMVAAAGDGEGFVRSGNVWVISLTIGLVVVAMFSWTRLLPLLLRDLGASDIQVGIAWTLINLAMTLCQVPGGILADRYGRRPLIIIPTAVLTVLYLLASRAETWQSMVVYLTLVNAIGGLQSPSFTAIVAESVSVTRRGAAFAAFQFCVGLAVAVGPAVGAALAPWVDVRTFMAATGWMLLAVTVIRYFTLRETIQPDRRARLWRPQFTRPLVRILGAGSLLTAVSALTAWGPFFSLYAASVRAMSERDINLLFAAGSLASVCFTFAGGRAVDRLGAVTVLRLSMAVHVASVLLWLIPAASWAAALLLAVALSSMMVASVAWDTMRSAVVEGAARGAALGVIGTITAAVAGFAPAAAGALAERFGPAAPFALAAVLGVVLIVVAGASGRRVGDRQVLTE